MVNSYLDISFLMIIIFLIVKLYGYSVINCTTSV